jgi:hypothetical protein
MTTDKNVFIIPFILMTTLACAYVQNMVFPAVPTPALPTPTATSLPPTSSPTVAPTATPVFEAACPDLLAEVLKAATKNFVRTRGNEKPIHFLVLYTIKNNKLAQRQDLFVPEQLRSEWDARAEHESIWNYFKALIPEKDRTMVSEFSIMSDGHENILAAVGPTEDDLSKWGLKVDILDSGDPYLLTFTLLHEFGHLQTLNANQVRLDPFLFHNPDNQDALDRAVDACSQYFTGLGCSQPTSYLNEFFNRYWTDLYSEWQDIDQEEDKGERVARLADFYKNYQDQFLTDYAATSPAEDIAESWAFFVLSPRPELNSIANEKILFFYEYPELVTLRQEILERVCAEFPQ